MGSGQDDIGCNQGTTTDVEAVLLAGNVGAVENSAHVRPLSKLGLSVKQGVLGDSYTHAVKIMKAALRGDRFK